MLAAQTCLIYLREQEVMELNEQHLTTLSLRDSMWMERYAQLCTMFFVYIKVIVMTVQRGISK